MNAIKTTKVVSTRVPIPDYIEMLKIASANSMTISEYAFMKLYQNTAITPKLDYGGNVDRVAKALGDKLQEPHHKAQAEYLQRELDRVTKERDYWKKKYEDEV